MAKKQPTASKKTTKKKTTKKKSIKAPAKYILFVEDYLKDFNATRAYKTLHPNATQRTAEVEGSKYLRKPEVKAYLDQRLKERKESLVLDQKYVVDKAVDILESDYLGTFQYLTKDEIDQLDPRIRKLVTAVKLTKTNKSFRGGDFEESEVYELKFMSKDAAHTLLAKFSGTYEKDNARDITVKGFAASLKELDVPDE